MSRKLTTTILTTLIALMTMLLCSSVWAQESVQVWFANSPLFTVHNSAGGYTVAQRVNALQLRANALLGERKTLPTITVRRVGTDNSIYVDNGLFVTVTTVDAKAYGTTPAKLADEWAARMRTILPMVRAQHNPNNEHLSVIPVWRVVLWDSKPYMVSQTLMVPFKTVMNSLNIPFDYNSTARTIRANYSNTRTQHTVGTRTVNVNGKTIRMSVTSQITNGAIYVPAGYIELLTGKKAFWDQKSGVLAFS